MKRSLICCLLLFLTFVSCDSGKKRASNVNSEAFVQHEIAKWRKELLANGAVGTPCGEDKMKWIALNPESYYGLPDTIQYKKGDCNQDGKEDILLYFEAGECCTGGHEEGSDFLTLYYSSGDDYLRNDHLRTEIAEKIESEYFRLTQTDVARAIFSVSEFKGEIKGNFKLWTLEDPDCCASIEGMFTYNTKSWVIKISYQAAK